MTGKSRKIEVEVVNKMGIHARPASLIVQEAQGFKSDVLIHKNGEKVNAKSILSVMMLAAEQGTKLIIEAEGPDAEETLQAMKELFEKGFGEYLK